MPEARLPGGYVEEGSGPPPIRGVDFSGTAFVGPTLIGPIGTVSDPLSTFAEFETLYGDVSHLDVDLPLEQRRNQIALAARAYFENGGRRLFVVRLAHGSMALPAPSDYQAALDALGTAAGFSIIAAPGFSARLKDDYLAIRKALQDHVADASLRRFAVLDPPPDVDPVEMRDLRGDEEVQRAALYYPWICAVDPVGGEALPIRMPPCGFVCGIYERIAREDGLWKAPANEPLNGALGLERNLSGQANEWLSEAGVNTLRTFPDSAPRIWGARTLSNDAVWKYISVRRYFDYLERSIEEGTRWAVFEPNGEKLWAAIRRVVGDFLTAEWRQGGLVGVRPEEAFFFRCDRTTMTQDDIDNGRLIILIGVAPLRPAEFVIFRIGQWVQSGSDDDDD